MIQSRSLGCRIVLFFLLLFVALNWKANAQGQPSAQNVDRQHVQLLEDQAAALLDRENQNPSDVQLHSQRVNAFAAAAAAIQNYSDKYWKPTELPRLLLTYRAGVNFEFAENLSQAQSMYTACEEHPLYHDAGAVYNGVRIDVLVPGRIYTLTSLMHIPGNTPVIMITHSGIAANPDGTYVVGLTNVSGQTPPRT